MGSGRVRELDEAVAGGGLHGVQPACEGAFAGVPIEMQPFVLGRTDDADALAEQPGGAVPDAGVAVALGRLDGGRDGDAVSAGEGRDDGVGRRIKRETQTTLHGLQRVTGVCRGADTKIDGLHLLGNLLIGERAM